MLQSGNGDFFDQEATARKAGYTSSKTRRKERRSLSSTNAIESALDTAHTVTRRVKKWHDDSVKKRWCAAGLRNVEQNFRRIKGYADLNQLTAALEELVPKPSTLETQAEWNLIASEGTHFGRVSEIRRFVAK